MKERYNIIKAVYPNYLIYIRKKEKVKVFGIDKDIIDNFGSDNINYIVLDNLDIVKIVKYDNNLYDTYKLYIKVIEVIKKIGKELVIYEEKINNS